MGLTSIHWRESWKYGERAFRYCHHDVGHAIGSFAVSAAGLGWEAKLLESVTDGDLAVLLGVHVQTGVEAEHPDCLLAVFPQGAGFTIDEQRVFTIVGTVCDELRGARWSGAPNRLSSDHHLWPVIDEVAAATEKLSRPGEAFWSPIVFENSSLEIGDSPLALRRIIHQRRSAVALDGHTGITRDAFYQILLKVMPGSRQVPFTTLPWRPCVDLLLFVHRVADLTPGLYALLRDPTRKEALERAMDRAFAWTRPEACPDVLAPLLARGWGCAPRRPTDELRSGNRRRRRLRSGHAHRVPRVPRGVRARGTTAACIGRQASSDRSSTSKPKQAVSVAPASAAFSTTSHTGCSGSPATGFQVLYHFTMGGPVDDPRLQTHPPYQHLAQSRRGAEEGEEPGEVTDVNGRVTW